MIENRFESPRPSSPKASRFLVIPPYTARCGVFAARVSVILFLANLSPSQSAEAPVRPLAAPPLSKLSHDASASSPKVPAFPGAAGFGQFAIGGRGGRVLEVTNLNDSGPGSLRACLETPGPRTCIFKVAGTISLERELVINYPFLTIAGQTAPGGGIALKDRGLIIRASHVIVRYLRVRPGQASLPNNNNGISILAPDPELEHPEASTQNVIIDHCSISWGTDDNMMAWGDGQNGVSDITFQWNIISEGLNCQSRVPGCGSRGLLIGNGANNISVHHNLFAHNFQRHPESLFGCDLDFANNLIYNYGARQSPAILAGRVRSSHVNMIANYYRQGPEGPPQRGADVRLIGGTNKSTLFVSSNIGTKRPALNAPEQALLWNDSGGFTLVSAPHRFPTIPITNPFDARDEVMQNAGALLPAQDVVDRRVISEVIKGTGRIINYPEEVGGWPVLDPGTPLSDSDRDGMPNAWELQHHLNPEDGNDGRKDNDQDGYTNLEEFLNGTIPSK